MAEARAVHLRQDCPGHVTKLASMEKIHYSTRPQRLLFHAPADEFAVDWSCRFCLFEKVRPLRP